MLIGMPAVGKSTVGVVVAKRLGYDFLDTDLLIQAQEKKLLYQIIEEVGIDGFIAIENQVNRDVEVTKTVIAPGGSAVYCQEAMEKFKKNSTMLYLRLSLKELERRLGNVKERGVVLREGQSLKMLYEERTVLFEKYADIIVDEDGKTVDETIQEVLKKLVD